MPTNTYVALNTQTVTGSPASSVTFTSIPQGYTDLFYVIAGTSSSGTIQYRMQFNGDTASNYSATILYGTGSTAGSTRQSTQTSIFLGSQSSTDTQGNMTGSIMNYSNTTTNKTVISRYNAPAIEVGSSVGLWRSTAAITSVTIFTSASTMPVGTTLTLYGIAAASVGAKATGGTIYSDASYFYHVFSGNGTFTPSQTLSCDLLMVAGGGGAGDAGGGAGGVVTYSAQSLTATNYTVTIGAGGSPGKNATNNAGIGTDTTFTGLTSATGGGPGQVPNRAAYSLAGGSGGGSIDATIDGGTGSQGSNGGKGYTDGLSYDYGGGGGGYSVAGGNAAALASGFGGNGISTYSSWGAATGTGQNVAGTYWYAGGGAGGGGKSGQSSTIGAAGYGGGGSGWYIASGTGGPTSGTANTGGGGGGGTGTNFAGAGGSGIVIVRYAK